MCKSVSAIWKKAIMHIATEVRQYFIWECSEQFSIQSIFVWATWPTYGQITHPTNSHELTQAQTFSWGWAWQFSFHLGYELWSLQYRVRAKCLKGKWPSRGMSYTAQTFLIKSNGHAKKKSNAISSTSFESEHCKGPRKVQPARTVQ